MENEPVEMKLCKNCKYSVKHLTYWCENPKYAPPSSVDGEPRALSCVVQRSILKNVKSLTNCPEYSELTKTTKTSKVQKVLLWLKNKVY